MPDKLDSLFMTDEELNKDVLFEILDGKVKIIEEGDVLIIGNFSPLKTILLYTLSKKVMFLKNKHKSELIGPREISMRTRLPEGTAKVYVRKLERMGFLLRKREGYIIPNFSLNKIKDFFVENGKDK